MLRAGGRFADHVLRFVTRRVRSVEDITQNVMPRLHRAALEESEQIEAWLHRVALEAIADVDERQYGRGSGPRELGPAAARPLESVVFLARSDRLSESGRVPER